MKKVNFREIIEDFYCIEGVKVLKNEVIVLGFNNESKKKIKNYSYSYDAVAREVKNKVQNFIEIKG